MSPRRHSKHGIQLLQRARLRLGQAKVRKDEAKDVPRRVPSESALFGEGIDESGPGEGEDEVEAPAGGSCEGHADVAEVERL